MRLGPWRPAAGRSAPAPRLGGLRPPAAPCFPLTRRSAYPVAYRDATVSLSLFNKVLCLEAQMRC